jgi:hypothetical protein
VIYQGKLEVDNWEDRFTANGQSTTTGVRSEIVKNGIDKEYNQEYIKGSVGLAICLY